MPIPSASVLRGPASSLYGNAAGGVVAFASDLSAPAGGVGPVKRMILSTDLSAAKRGLNSLLGLSSSSIRGEIESLARKLNIAV